MKRNVMASVLSLLMLLSLCCGCQGKNGEGGESTNAPDSSRLLYFDEIFSLSQHHPVVWTDVVVQKVYPDVYTDKYAGEAYLLASCKVQKTFLLRRTVPIKRFCLRREATACCGSVYTGYKKWTTRRCGSCCREQILSLCMRVMKRH